MWLLYFAVVLVLVFCLVICGYALFIAYRRKKLAHLPGPPITSFFKGNLGEVLKKCLAEGKTFQELFIPWHLKYGNIVCCWFYHTSFVSVADPDAIKDLIVKKNLPKSPFAYNPLQKIYGQRALGYGLVTQINHEKWAKRRKIFNPAFHRSSLKDMMAAFNSSTDLFIEKLLEKADGKTEVVMVEEFARATLDVISKVAFGTNLNVITDLNSKFTHNVYRMFTGMRDSQLHPLGRLNPFRWNQIHEIQDSIKSIRQTGEKIIEERQLAINHGEQVPNDILQRILSIAEEDPSADIKDMLDEFLTFFVAGHETTANKLSFCLMELCDHEHIQKRLKQEVYEVLGDRKSVHFEDLSKMHQLGETLKETLRMYPPAGTFRVTEKDEIVNGHLIPAGTDIMFSTFVMGRLPAFWENPEEFNPTRFEEEEHSQRSHFTYFPFSLGPRNCIGQHFAQIEAKVLLSRFIQTFTFKLVPGQTKALMDKMTICPRDGVICTLERRENP